MKKILSLILSSVLCASCAACFAGCGSDSGSKTENKGEVNVYNWDEYISDGENDLKNVIEEFEEETGIKVNYTTYSTNEELYNKLRRSCSVGLYDKQAHPRKNAARAQL